MKPTKNRVYCPDSGRQKMLFETEKKAYRFIEFNADEIASENGYAPNRAYFCIACAGWHITSRRQMSADYVPLTERVIEAYEQEKSFKESLKEEQLQKESQKTEELRIILEEIKNDISSIQYLADYGIDYSDFIKEIFLKLEKAKSVNAVFKKSTKRIKNAEKVLNLWKMALEKRPK